MNNHYDFYKSLGLSRDASTAELGGKIRETLEDLHRKGKPGGDPQVQENLVALAVLGDDPLRGKYDSRLDDDSAPAIGIPELRALAATGNFPDEAPSPQGGKYPPQPRRAAYDAHDDDATTVLPTAGAPNSGTTGTSGTGMTGTGTTSTGTPAAEYGRPAAADADSSGKGSRPDDKGSAQEKNGDGPDHRPAQMYTSGPGPQVAPPTGGPQGAPPQPPASSSPSDAPSFNAALASMNAPAKVLFFVYAGIVGFVAVASLLSLVMDVADLGPGPITTLTESVFAAFALVFALKLLRPGDKFAFILMAGVSALAAISIIRDLASLIFGDLYFSPSRFGLIVDALLALAWVAAVVLSLLPDTRDHLAGVTLEEQAARKSAKAPQPPYGYAAPGPRGGQFGAPQGGQQNPPLRQPAGRPAELPLRQPAGRIRRPVRQPAAVWAGARRLQPVGPAPPQRRLAATARPRQRHDPRDDGDGGTFPPVLPIAGVLLCLKLLTPDFRRAGVAKRKRPDEAVTWGTTTGKQDHTAGRPPFPPERGIREVRYRGTQSSVFFIDPVPNRRNHHMATIIWTRTDEAPLLATYSLKPIVEAFASQAGIDVETRDISLAGRIIAQFPERLSEDQRIDDELSALGELVKKPEANIIKLPNISASVPQIKRAVAELQEKGYDIPKYLTQPETEEERADRARFDKVKGSAVNPVLREGNSDRRAPEAVKNFARKHPHRMGEWSPESKTNVATMASNDFRHNEKSVVMEKDDTITYLLETDDGHEIILKKDMPVLAGEIIDGTGINSQILSSFLKAQIKRAKRENILFSVHLKATMMKVSDPLIFGEVVKAFFPSVYPKFEAKLASVNLTPDYGIGVILNGLHKLDTGTAAAVKAAIERDLAEGPDLYMVNSDKGITNLHVPSDVIVDASMPALIRNGGKGWGPDGEEKDTLAVIPDSSYAGVYQAVIEDCKANGAYDPTTMGTVPNVGLMAQKAEEYGSHDKTFQMPENGVLQVVNSAGDVLIEHHVARGDIWRSCQTKDAPIRDWVKLAVTRARATGDPAVFWLDPSRAHDANLIRKVEEYLKDHDTEGLDIRIMDPVSATKLSVQRIREGKNTISVTGNVLRDYLTDLFPIMELGTSAKMLSVVPLMAGGGLFETGAGGSAPKHVQQVLEENHLRWDSLGEFLALAESLRYAGNDDDDPRAGVLADALDRATSTLLENGKSPSRKAGEIDNRGSHFYLALYWAQELAAQDDNAELKEAFGPVAEALAAKEESITKTLIDVQGEPADLGGYFLPDDEKANAVMRPSAEFNEIIDGLRK